MLSTQTIDSLRLIGNSDPMHQLYKMIGRICNADCAVLLIGEKGTGKSMVAQALHYFSHRTPFPFHILRGKEALETNDEELLGMDESHPIEATCYITDFISMPSFVQHQIVGIHRKKEFKCSHSNQIRKHNLRFIVSSESNLKEQLESGQMPVDLFYDWNFLPLFVPPLRDRKEDIPLLVHHFVELLAPELKVSHKEFSPEALEILVSHEWPGNLTELKACVKSALAACRGNYIRAEHLPELKSDRNSEALTSLEMFLSSKLSAYVENAPSDVNGNLFRLLLPQIETSVFRYALKKSRGNKNRAARFLGLHRNTLNKKLQHLA